MKTKGFKLILIVSIVIFSGTMLMNCVPPPATTAEAPVEEKPEVDHSICDRYLSFAYQYYQNNSWEHAVKNFNKMLEMDCEEDYANDIFKYLGRAYMQLGSQDAVYLDSALYAFQRGLEYSPGDAWMIKTIAYIYGQQGNDDMQIREYEKLAEADPTNIEYFQTLIKLYFKTERYRDVLWAVDKVLEVDPGNQDVINDRLTAFKNLGMDETQVLEDAWNSEKSTRTGLDYANALKDKNEYDGAIIVLKEVTGSVDRKNLQAWTMLLELYDINGMVDESIAGYEYIISNVSPSDVDAMVKLSTNYLAKYDYSKALSWADKAIATNATSEAYAAKADVYSQGADAFKADPIIFEDKLVYKLAYDNYKKSYAKGNPSVKNKIDTLKEYYIPTVEDWFLNTYNADGSKRTDYTPKPQHYDWVKESASKD